MILRVNLASDPGLTLNASITNPCAASYSMMLLGSPFC